MARPRLGVRLKFQVVTVLIVAAVDLAAGVYLEAQLRAAHNHRVETEVSRHARAAREIISRQIARGQLELSVASLDPLADSLGESMSARITVLGPEGAVLADSSLTPAEIAVVENHGERPEVLAAGFDRCGLARRYSETLGEDMLYCALAFELGGGDGSEARAEVAHIRVAMLLEVIDDSIRQLRLSLLLGGLLALALAVGAGHIAARVFTAKLHGLVEAAQAVAHSDANSLAEFGTDEVGGLVGTFNRVSSELERAVRELAHQRDSFEAVIDSMADGLIVVDAQRRIVVLNPAAAQLLAIPAEARGRPLVEVTRAPQLLDAVSQALAGASSSFDIDVEVGGVRRLMVGRATPQSEGEGVVLVLHDETELRRLETIRRDFVANVSHELRTPASVIRANSETLLSGALDDRRFAERFVAAIERNAKRLEQLISDLLDISRIDAGKYRLDIGPVELARVVERACASVEAHRSQRSVELELDVEPELEVLADPSALEQILVNMIENAIKYGPERGQVSVRSRVRAEQVRVEVEDEGAGIPPAHRARVFERFYRVDPGRSRHMGGTGLGLAIVKNLTEAMGGQVGFEPREPQGARFWIALRRPSAGADATLHRAGDEELEAEIS